ncbi:AraC family transcriptional regulator [Marinicellulosiphila megalodicopiae]|uniref:AraC family transcriptional regulator n=1 Tax=Marinicellulosiphila megalodicopiae TaxID=2724896 RepID=UPI003BB1AF81
MNILNRLSIVIAFIDKNPTSKITISQLSKIACLSPYHFQRIFKQQFGVTVGQYLKLIRLKRASFQIFFRTKISMTDIALDNGYESYEGFSRAIKHHLHRTPKQFRTTPTLEIWFNQQMQIQQIRQKIMNINDLLTNYEVEIVEFKTLNTMSIKHSGHPKMLAQTLQRFINWRKQNGLSPDKSRTFNIPLSPPLPTNPEAFSFVLAAQIPHSDFAYTQDFEQKTFPTMRCAKVRHIGSDDQLTHIAKFLQGAWLHKSGEQKGELPLFFERVSFFPDVPENEMIVDVYLPLA